MKNFLIDWFKSILLTILCMILVSVGFKPGTISFWVVTFTLVFILIIIKDLSKAFITVYFRLSIMEIMKKISPYRPCEIFQDNNYIASYQSEYNLTDGPMCGIRGWREITPQDAYRRFSDSNQQKEIDNSLKVDRI